MFISKKRISEITNVLNSPLMKKYISENEVKPEDLFTSNELLAVKWESACGLAEEVLKNMDIRFNMLRGVLYTFDKVWTMEPNHNNTPINKYLRKMADEDKYPKDDIAYGKINEEIMFESKTFKYSGKIMEGTRYSIYVFQNGTLYYDQETGDYEFKNSFFPDDEVRDEENPMFNYDFIEDYTGLKELFRVFYEWGPGKLKQLVYILSYIMFCKKDFLNLLFYLVGRGANGKSMFLKLIEDLFPKDAVTHLDISKMTGDKDGSQVLEKSYINASGEIRMEDFDTIFFKKITGGDPIDVNIKNEKDRLSFVSYAKHIVSSNEDPTLRTTTHGDLRRFLIIKFDKQFAMVQNFYEDRMKSYIPQLFFFLLKLSKKIKQNKMFINPNFLSDTKEVLKEKSSSVYQFMKEFDIVYDANVLNTVSKFGRDDRKVYANYQLWCKKVGRQAFSKQRFFNDMDVFLNIKTKVKGSTYGRYITANNIEAWDELTLQQRH